MNQKVKDFMTPFPKTIGVDNDVSHALAMMKELSCHHLPVMDGGRLVGIISDRDLQVCKGLDQGLKIQIRDIMMDEPFMLNADATVKEAVQILLDEKINSVICSASESSPWGIFTTTDALKYLNELI